ncbi:MAG: cytochrome hydroxylase [Solirubrobacterales bacterium]|nr:cytochrome hydroxylase [Solirubrobacterales bacterium]
MTRPTLDAPDADISARAFWAQDYEIRERVFQRFREECPISWHRPYESELMPPDDGTPGFWSVWRHEEIRTVSRNAKVFCSGRGILMEDFPEVVSQMSQSFLAMDDPEHAQLRSLVSQAFRPRRMRTIEEWVRGNVVELVDELLATGEEADFCEAFAKLVPGRIFADFFGLPEGQTRHDVMDAAEKLLAWDDPEAAQGRSALETYGEEAQRLLDICFELIEERRATPGEDLLTWLVQAEIGGRTLEDWEIGSFFCLLAAAGNDTTRHSLAHGLSLLTRHPEQRALLLEDLDGRLDGCVEEIMRYATPVMQFRRTATQDTQLGGVPIAAGDKVVMWYSSGNRDASAFADAGSFDILRTDENRHLGFGGGGPHYCMGAAFGRMMVKHSLRDIYTRVPDIAAGVPVFQVNNFINGIAAMPARWTPPV